MFAVTTPAAELSLLTLAELRAATGLSGQSNDAELMALGRGASTAIARRCCIVDDGVSPPSLLRETCTETLRWTGCGPIRLSRRPVTQIVSVTVAGALRDPGSYEIGSGRGLYSLTSDTPNDWPAGRIVVVYQAGYPTAPYDLKLAATKLVTALNAEKARDPSLKREDIPGVLEREYWVAPSDDPFLSKEIDDLISPFVEMWV